MKNSRRQFLKSGAVLGLAVAIPAKAAETFNTQATAVEKAALVEATAGLKLKTLAKQLNTDFRVCAGPFNEQSIKLVKITEARDEKKVECFSLIFEGSSSAPLAQDSYTIRHGKMGEFALFIVPGKKQQDKVYYQAVFNRLRQ